MFFSTIFSTVS